MKPRGNAQTTLRPEDALGLLGPSRVVSRVTLAIIALAILIPILVYGADAVDCTITAFWR